MSNTGAISRFFSCGLMTLTALTFSSLPVWADTDTATDDVNGANMDDIVDIVEPSAEEIRSVAAVPSDASGDTRAPLRFSATAAVMLAALSSDRFATSTSGQAGTSLWGAPIAVRDIDYRLWLGRSSFSAGLGTTLRWEESRQPGTDPSRPTTGGVAMGGNTPRNLVLGVRFNLSSRSRLVIDRAIIPIRYEPTGIPSNAGDRPFGVGLEFRPANAAALAGLRQGTLMKLKLSNSSTLGLRARKGKAVVTWRAQW